MSLGKVDKGSRITPIPRVDCLVRIAHNADVVIVAEPSVEQAYLCWFTS